MSIEALATIALMLATLPAALVALNLLFYRMPRPTTATDPATIPRVSVLIPARNEERSIRRAVESALRNRGVELEVVVMDDHSDDRTAAIVHEISRRDSRVRSENAPALPPDWCGKQHACHHLARVARHPLLVFMDADVQLAPDALSRMAGFLSGSGADLASGIPRQRTGTLLERLVVPLIHFVLLGFLPLPAMRLSRSPALAAGCGQLFVTRRESYRVAGGHVSLKNSRHDGITLPRAFRRAGLRTDLFDATALADCRMYRSAQGLWHGFAKNATEGMAAPAAILPWTAILFGGQVLPALLLLPALRGGSPESIALVAIALTLGFSSRFLLAWRFRQSWVGALLHPLGVLIVLAIQWYAWSQALLGRSVAWKGRARVHH